MKKETESLIRAAQEQAIRKKAINSKLGKAEAKNKLRFSGKMDGTVRHIVCECPMLAQREYKRRLDWVSRRIH